MGEEGWSVGIDDGARSYMHLADLIDPECWARTVEDNLAMIERNRELEAELAGLEGKVGMNGETCATCDSFERCFSSGRELRCGSAARGGEPHVGRERPRVDILGDIRVHRGGGPALRKMEGEGRWLATSTTRSAGTCRPA